ncbi:putative disease resistance protein RGA3 [Amaranthus tricolor]|uniref:putative disease resistance protein RGA3 n=1 Tax=Amaranthus tricolor TaxID=29722 RepID=UPI00258D12B6|nr:putative disease resistance protein RGA3 [Amaranthus tricolor]
MAEAIIMPVAKVILGKIVSLIGDHVHEEIKAVKSAKSDLRVMVDKVEAICAVLQDAEERQFGNRAIKLWLRDLKRIVYDIDDLLDEVTFDALQRRVNKGHLGRQLRYYLSSSNPFISRYHLSNKIRDLRHDLENIVAKKTEFGLTERPIEYPIDENKHTLDGSSFVYKPDVIGREKDRQDVLDRLISLSDANRPYVLPIVGMGGIGKTALAKVVYKDVHHFDLKLWARVSDTFLIPKILKDILLDSGIDNIPNHDMNVLVKKLQSLLDGKKYFLVLDDVWVEDIAIWMELKNILAVGKPGSVILITTRIPNVALCIGNLEPYNLNRLSDEDCWSVFKRLAFKEGEEGKYPVLEDIGLSIVQKCCGIPLVVKCLASILRCERNDQRWLQINNMDSFTELDQQYDKVLQLLKLSYDKLPSHLKPCFAYMSLFVKNIILTDDAVFNMWTALGLLPVRNREEDIDHWRYSFIQELVSKSVLQESIVHFNGVSIQCQLHDLFHDVAKKILGEELVVVTHEKMEVSEFGRHIIWEYEGASASATGNELKDMEFPKELLKLKHARTFRFGYAMRAHLKQSFVEAIISNFCCLRILDLGDIWFEELPETIGNLKHLRYLDLSNNCIIRSLPNAICKLLNLQTFCISGCRQLEGLPKDFHHLQSLKKIELTTCELSLVHNKLMALTSLQQLCLFGCPKLVSLWENSDVGNLTSLRHLFIKHCHKLARLPNNFKFLNGLQTLGLVYCEELDMEEEESLKGLQNLQLLMIRGIPKLKILPRGLLSVAASLQHLVIRDCEGLVDLPDWLHCMTSLRSITIESCRNLSGLPNTFCHLKLLQKLTINNSPL